LHIKVFWRCRTTVFAITVLRPAAMSDPLEVRPRKSSGMFEPLHVGGVRQSSLTLIQTALGAGFLTLAYAMKLSGLGLSLAVLFFDAAVVYFGIEIMMRGAFHFQAKDTATLLSRCMGAWSRPALDALLVCYGNGAMIAYFIICGDFIPGILNDLVALSWISPLPYAPAELRSRCILGALLVVVPLSIPATLSALRYVAPVALVSVLSSAVMIMIKCPAHYGSSIGRADFGDINWWTIDFNFFKSFSILIFAYNCHMNIVPVASELQKTSSRDIAKISRGVVMLLVVFYAAIGTGGYLSFLGQTHQNVLTNYSLSLAVTTCRVLLCSSIMVAIPTNLTPTARSIEGLLKVMSSSATSAPEGGLNSALLSEDTGKVAGAQDRRGAALTLALKACCLTFQIAVALSVSSVADVMAFLGASCGTVMMMMIPLAVLFTARFEDYSRAKFWLAAVLLGLSTTISILALVVMTLQKIGVLAE